MAATKISSDMVPVMRCLIVVSIAGLFPNLLKVDATAIASELVFDGVELMSAAADAAFHREKILDRHNYLRSREAENGFGSGAVYMNRLVYDVGLEAYARNYARHMCSTGKWEHSKRAAPLRVARGENLYTNSVDYSSTPSRNFDSAQIVQKWWDERQYFDWHAENPSQSAQRQGKMVGHWTQVVRAEASTVGCWIVTGCQCTAGRSCQKANGGRWATYVACHYDYGNLGSYPYWPLNTNIQYRIPTTVTQNRRQRCGSCPKGFNQCGTTIGGQEKRDAYLCVGYWNINESMPPADLLRKSIIMRHSSSGIPSWYFMVRNCTRGNGSCPSNASCWAYGKGRTLAAEPPVLVNQCQCHGFSTQYGIYFERDMCGQYSAIQPYYDADAFLGFTEIGGLNTSSATRAAHSPSSTGVSDQISWKGRLSTTATFLDSGSSLAELGMHDGSVELDQTSPLTETAEEAADLIIQSDEGSLKASVKPRNTAVDSISKQKLHFFSPTATNSMDEKLTFLSLRAASDVVPPLDDVMFEWKNVRDPQLIARRPGVATDAIGNAVQVATTLRGIRQHRYESVSTPLSTVFAQQSLGVESGHNELSIEGDTPKEPVETPGLEQVERNASTTTDSLPHEETQASASPTSPEVTAEEGPPIADIVDEEENETALRGAPVNVMAVQKDAREKNKYPLPYADEARNEGTRKPEPSGGADAPSERKLNR
uniref:SCP family extracellular subfamily protein n=1 Tax=Toxoplasma gondii COUG TaxID=1074873 RepID=A0A2G8XQK5_TOXGO|nr:SCP family extracellular subfamily protein [Toxoplasma gondii COUG]